MEHGRPVVVSLVVHNENDFIVGEVFGVVQIRVREHFPDGVGTDRAELVMEGASKGSGGGNEALGVEGFR
jgi:uncharacterized membrane protein